MGETKAIIDTNVLYAGLYSSRGASYRVLRAIEHGIVRIALSTTLLFEYEDILRRHQTIFNLSNVEIDAILDDLCNRSDHQAIYFLWRPQLPDPKDDHILELAVASGISTIVTHNLKDFAKAAEFGVKAITPKQLLEEIE
jgi:putative PIN family toxin of toxin-antitoxin system